MRKNKACFLALLIMCSVEMFAQNSIDPSSTGPTISGSTFILSQPMDYSNGINTGSSALNFSRTWVPAIPITNSQNVDENSSTINVKQFTSYFDGLGRVIETVDRAGSGGAVTGDIVTPYNYKPGTQKVTWMPYVTSTGSKFRLSPFAESNSFYNANYPIESNYCNGSIKYSSGGSGGTFMRYLSPGISYLQNDKGITVKYSTGSQIRKITVQNNLPVNDGVYGFQQLLVRYSEVDGGNNRAEYYDKSGKLIYVKELSDIGECSTGSEGGGGSNGLGTTPCDIYAETYYVYDEMERLRYVLPPNAVTEFATNNWQFTPTLLKNLCVYYSYNEMGDVNEVHSPGQDGNTLIVYDKRHRQVLSQTAAQTLQGQWLFTLYDDMNRPVIRGVTNSSRNSSSWASFITNNSPSASYTDIENYLLGSVMTTYPSTLQNSDILEYFYYDNYQNLSGINSFNGSEASTLSSYNVGGFYFSTYSDPIIVNYLTKGKLTGKKIKVLKATGSALGNWITSAYYYDYKDRLVQEQTLNPYSSNNLDISTYQYDFNGRLLRSLNTHSNTTSSNKQATSIAKSYTYFQKTFKISKVEQKLDNGPWTQLSNFNYNSSTGVLELKTLGPNVENQRYTFDIRGALTGINSDFAENDAPTIPGTNFNNITFGESLKREYGFTKRLTNGNISGVIWRSSGSSRRSYAYEYNYSGKLTAASFNEFTDPTNSGSTKTWNNTNTDYSVSNLKYDLAGNIKSMFQRGMGIPSGYSTKKPVDMDDLSYTYENNGASNRLSKIEDVVTANYSIGDFINNNVGTTDYEYDANGNLTKDLNKKIATTTYNFFNKPIEVNFINGDKIRYSYDASGNRLQSIITSGSATTTYDYWGPFIYKDNQLVYVLHEEGRARYNSNNSFTYDFFVRDHLGNVRTVVTPETAYPDQYLATHEIALANIENLVFTSIDDVREPKPISGNPGDLMAAELDGSDPNKRVGTSLLLHVMAGDRFNLSAQAYYNEGEVYDNHISSEDMLNSIVGSLMSGGNFGSGEGGMNPPQIINGVFSPQNYVNSFQNILDSLTDVTKPRGFLNYIVFDENMNIVSEQSGAIQVSTANAWHDLQMANDITVAQNGYLSIFISNSSSANTVWMDNVRLIFNKGKLLEEKHYYPFGLAIDEGTAPSSNNKFLFQTNEMQDELGLNLYDFNYRQYDAQIGRFTGVDPIMQLINPQSPYNFCLNNPVSFVDPLGLIAGSKDKNDKRNLFTWLKAAFNQIFGGGDQSNASGKLTIEEAYFNAKYNDGERFELDNVDIVAKRPGPHLEGLTINTLTAMSLNFHSPQLDFTYYLRATGNPNMKPLPIRPIKAMQTEIKRPGISAIDAAQIIYNRSATQFTNDFRRVLMKLDGWVDGSSASNQKAGYVFTSSLTERDIPGRQPSLNTRGKYIYGYTNVDDILNAFNVFGAGSGQFGALSDYLGGLEGVASFLDAAHTTEHQYLLQDPGPTAHDKVHNQYKPTVDTGVGQEYNNWYYHEHLIHGDTLDAE